MDIKPLVVNVPLAKVLGLNNSIVVQQIHYWLKINESRNVNFIDGKYWMYKTFDSWSETFCFWDIRTIKRLFKSLEEQNIIITGNFNKNKLDRTKWYTINYQMIEQIKNSTSGVKGSKENDKNKEQKNDDFDDFNSEMSPSCMAKCHYGLCQNVTMDDDRLPLTIPKTKEEIKLKRLNKDIIIISDSDKDINKEEVHVNNNNNSTSTTRFNSEDKELKEVFELYEREGFGTGSYVLLEQLQDLIKEYSSIWVKEAIKRTVINDTIDDGKFKNKKNIAYLEKILRVWRKKGGIDHEHSNFRADNSKDYGLYKDSKTTRASEYEQIGVKFSGNDDFEF